MKNRNRLMTVTMMMLMSTSVWATDAGSLMASIGQNSAMDNPKTAKAMNQLIAIGESAVEEIVEKMNDPRTAIQQQWSLANILGKIGSEKAIAGLISNLQTTNNDWHRSVVSSALVAIGQPSVDALRTVVQNELSGIDSTKLVKYPAAYAARTLGQLGAKDAKKEILELLEKEFTYSLTRNGSWGATPYIKKMMMDALVMLEANEAVALIDRMIEQDKDVNTGLAQDARERFDFVLGGKNPFVIFKPLGTVNPKRIYVSSYTGGTRIDRDAETGDTVNYRVIPAGSISE